MVRVALGVAEGVEQPSELVGMVAGRPDREVGSAEGRQQLEPCVAELTSPSQVNGAIRSEALEQGAERGRPDVVKRARGCRPRFLLAHETRPQSLATLGQYVRVAQAWDHAATQLGL